MYTATTPKLTFEVEDNCDLTQADRVWVTINNKKDEILLEKDLTVEDADTASVVLTQTETLALPVGTHLAQINFLYTVDSETRRGAFDKVEIHVYRNNKNEVVVE